MKWEYWVTSIPQLSSKTDFLNGLGEEGWELVSVAMVEGQGETAYLERPVKKKPFDFRIRTSSLSSAVDQPERD